MKHVLTGLCLLLALQTLQAQKPAETLGWKNTASVGMNLSQASFDNWAGGGEDAMSYQVDLKGKAERLYTQSSLELRGRVSYGESRVGETAFRKSTDEVRLGATFTFKRGNTIKPYISSTFMTQLADGFIYDDTAGTETQTSELLDPAYLTESAGVGIEPITNLKLKLGAAAKQTFSSEEYMWADDPDTATEIETMRSEFGVEVQADYEHKFNDNVGLATSLKLFSNLEGIAEIDSDWDTSLTAQLTKAIQMSLNVRILRDADISARRQWKQNLAIGIVYTIL